MITLTPDQKLAGLLVPTFAIRTENDLGVGDTAAMRQMIDWCAQIGLKILQVLPINETGNDNSPYNAISSMALEPTTLELTPAAVPELTEHEFQEALATVDLSRLRQGPVNYPLVRILKRRLIEAAFARFESGAVEPARQLDHDRFSVEHAGWLGDYSLFRTLIDEHGSECWDYWPPEQTSVASAKAWLDKQSAELRANFERRMRLHRYTQWLAYSQWRAVKAYADTKGVALMGDIPFGISYYSADVFANPEIFDLKWSGGAPPEPYFKDDLFTQIWGQNWGIPLYRWEKMRENNFAWWRQRVGGVGEMFHLFRIDHILGFFRIYSFPWRPQENLEYLHLSREEAKLRTGGELPGFKPYPDDTAEHCEANRLTGQEFLKMILEASGETRLIGEDLGMVPDYVRPTLRSLDIAGFKIPLWERWHNGQLTPGNTYERLSVATYATHDHEPLKALFERWEQEVERETRGEPDSGHAANEAREGARRLLEFAGLPWKNSVQFTQEVHIALLQALFKANSWITIAMITDLFGRSERFNVPGAVAESNWSRRMHMTVLELTRDPETVRLMGQVRRAILESGR